MEKTKEIKTKDILYVSNTIWNRFIENFDDGLYNNTENLSQNLFLTTSFYQDPNVILSIFRVPLVFESIFTRSPIEKNGKIITTNIANFDIKELEYLLPINVGFNGIIYTQESDDVNSELLTSILNQAKELLNMLNSKNNQENEDKYIVLLKRDRKTEWSKRITPMNLANGNQIQLIIDPKDNNIFEISKEYYNMTTIYHTINTIGQLSLKQNQNINLLEKYKLGISIKNSGLFFIFNEKELPIQQQLNDDFKNIKTKLNKPRTEGNNFLSAIPIIELQLFNSKKPLYDDEIIGTTIEISNEKIILLKNQYQISGYVKFSEDIQGFENCLQKMIQRLKSHIELVEKLQNKAPNYQKDMAYLSFLNNHIGHSIHALIFSNADESLMTSKKTIIHQICDLPSDRPFLTEYNTTLNIKAYKEAYQSTKLKNVHIGLNTKPVEGGKRSLIYGDYIYYHYNHDFNDKGWGCAYRSLQTLISWFNEQRYNNVDVPSITKIQEILVKMGDKPANFIGSKDWIGAFEVSLVLNHLLDIESKILYVSNGSDVVSHSQELKSHFMIEGTPIMIGGGVLAYTLLGIDYNEDTGDAKYLILDPHYTGSDNLKTIQDKGWIAWKDPKIFLEGSYYNFCLPQRKKYI